MILIAGPCVIESEEHTLRMAEIIHAEVCRCRPVSGMSLDFYFKASYDKANRSLLESYRGLGMDTGLEILSKVKDQVGCKVTTDVHECVQVPAVAEVADLIQIPALLCRQTDLLLAAGNTGKPVNVKKGQFMSPRDIEGITDKLWGNRVYITERGTSFGYGSLVVDMTGIPRMRKTCPVIIDATHSANRREDVRAIAKAATAVGVDGWFFEVHDNPDHAKCDGPKMITPEALYTLLHSDLLPISGSCG